MSNVPQAVRKQGERAEEMLKKAQEHGEQETNEQGQAVAQQQEEQLKKPEEPDYAHAYRTLQGKYNAEVPRLNQQLADQVKRNEELSRQIGELTTKIEELSTAKSPDAVRLLEDAGYDDDVVAAFRAQSTQIDALTKRNDQLIEAMNEMKSVKDRVERTEQTQAMTAQQRFIADLEAAVPDWGEVNDNKEFHAFLSGEDGFSGLTRQDVLSRAEKELDAATVIKLFKGFKGAKPKRAENIAPAAGQGGTQHEGGKVFSRAEVAQFYSDLAVGRIKHGPEAQAKEAEILKAQQEGRIR